MKSLVISSIRALADFGRIALTLHADEMRKERGVSFEEIESTVRSFDVIEEYLDAFPHPAMLMIGGNPTKPIHIVAGFDVRSGMIYIVTVYHPDETRFEPNLRTRRQRK